MYFIVLYVRAFVNISYGVKYSVDVAVTYGPFHESIIYDKRRTIRGIVSFGF